MNLIKKYRLSPKRTVITFECDKKLTLHKLGDLVKRNVIESINDDCLEKMEHIKASKDKSYDMSFVHSETNNIGYFLEGESLDGELGDKCERASKKPLEGACESSENGAVLENESCFAFKAYDSVKPADYVNREERLDFKIIDGNYKDRNLALKRNALKTEKSIKGGICSNKCHKILLCDALSCLLLLGLSIKVAIKLIKAL